MKIPSTRSLIAISLALSISTPAFPQSAPRKAPTHTAAAKEGQPAGLTDRERAIHALNRLTFGVRPGDVEALLAKGMDAWFEDQLHPESVDDSALNARLGPYATTRMNPKQLAQTFPSDGVIHQIIAGKRPMPDDPASKLVYSVNVARIQQQDAAKTAANAAASAPAVAGTMNVAVNSAMASIPDSPTPQDQARAIADKLLD